MPDGLVTNSSYKPRVGTCEWCGRADVNRKYTVYTEHGALYVAEVCLRCLEEARRGLEWEKRKEAKG